MSACLSSALSCHGHIPGAEHHAWGRLGTQYTFVKGMNLSVSTPYPQQGPVFPAAGTFSLATPPMTRGRRRGLSVSKFTCFKKKKSHSGFFRGGRFSSQFGFTAGRTAVLGNGLPLGLRIAQALRTTHRSFATHGIILQSPHCYFGMSKIF